MGCLDNSGSRPRDMGDEAGLPVGCMRATCSSSDDITVNARSLQTLFLDVEVCRRRKRADIRHPSCRSQSGGGRHTAVLSASYDRSKLSTHWFQSSIRKIKYGSYKV